MCGTIQKRFKNKIRKQKWNSEEVVKDCLILDKIMNNEKKEVEFESMTNQINSVKKNG